MKKTSRTTRHTTRRTTYKKAHTRPTTTDINDTLQTFRVQMCDGTTVLVTAHYFDLGLNNILGHLYFGRVTTSGDTVFEVFNVNRWQRVTNLTETATANRHTGDPLQDLPETDEPTSDVSH